MTTRQWQIGLVLMAMAVGCADEEQASGPTAPSLETGVQASAVPAGTPTSVEGVDGATHNNGAEETWQRHSGRRGDGVAPRVAGHNGRPPHARS